jgi:hypothetical protein
MKFAKTILERQTPEWSDKYVDYKRLKKILSQCSTLTLVSSISEKERATADNLNLYCGGKEGRLTPSCGSPDADESNSDESRNKDEDEFQDSISISTPYCKFHLEQDYPSKICSLGDATSVCSEGGDVVDQMYRDGPNHEFRKLKAMNSLSVSGRINSFSLSNNSLRFRSKRNEQSVDLINEGLDDEEVHMSSASSTSELAIFPNNQSYSANECIFQQALKEELEKVCRFVKGIF